MPSFERTNYGIKFSKAEIRCASTDNYCGTVTINTPKTDGDIQITFTPSGNVYIYHKHEQLIKITKKEKTK